MMEGFVAFNLIYEKWIPVQRKDETKVTIAPWQITEGIGSGNPISEIDAPRPDFNGALIQFLIGLVQTTMSPATEREWKNMLKNPPSMENLKSAFEKVSFAFEFDGDNARFMQDYDLSEGEECQVDNLLVEMPGKNTIKKNADHFLKRDSVQKMCFPCCATALFTLQTNAPAGGQGNRTSLRGGGPLTTIIKGNNLWETIWLNILEEEHFKNLGDMEKSDLVDVFPWLGPSRTSEKNQKVTSSDANPKQMFWGMPRRIRINFDTLESGICEICGRESHNLVEGYISKNYGINYEEGWRHVLTPYTEDKRGILPVHLNPGGISYRHWLGLIQNDGQGNKQPALIVDKFFDRQYKFNLSNEIFTHSPSIWAFGYDFDNMKARCWYESQMPLIIVNEDISAEYENVISQLIKSAEVIAENTRSCIKEALFRYSNNVKGDLSFIDGRFWKDTESEFYRTLHELHYLLTKGESTVELKLNWLKSLGKTSLKLFDEYSQSEFIGTADPKRISLARRDLGKYNSPKGQKLKTILGLPVENSTKR